MSQMSRNWCFTINNYTASDEQLCDTVDCKYIIYGKEVGEQGTPHLQGYIMFSTNKRLAAMKKIHSTAHWEIARGTSEQAITYCKKDGVFIERGEPPISKKRQGELELERWDQARKSAKLGNFDDVPSDIYIRYRNSLHSIHRDSQQVPESLDKLDFHWYYGATGTGKSRTAREDNPGYYVKSINKWWDGYENQPCVIIDEWSPDYKGMATLLKTWADHHPFSAEKKGYTVCIRPPKIIVTSNYSIEECFESEADRGPLLRRFQVRYFQ